jgi:multidrug resistance protein MdtO
MSSLVQSLPRASARRSSLWDFLQCELAPYRGRTALTARMVMSATLVVIIGMTFRIPTTAFASILTLVISRESLEATFGSARGMIAAGILSAANLILGALLVLGSPLLHFLWIGVTLFLAFYALSVVRNYGVAVIFGFVTAAALPLLDTHASAESKIESILWTLGAVALGATIALLVEAAFAMFRRSDNLSQGIDERLEAIQQLLTDFADRPRTPSGAQSAVQRLATVGASGLRRTLRRSSYNAGRKEQIGGLVALTGRLLDLGANLTDFEFPAEEDEKRRLRALAEDLAGIRRAIAAGTVPGPSPFHWDERPDLPLLGQMEKTLSLIHEVLAGGQSASAFELPVAENGGRNTALVPDAFSNPEHVKFAIRGSLAASLCYTIYNALFWPGLSTSLLTCIVTALTTIGASHQKQLLRFAGAIVGGVAFGMGAQVFLLPSMDSITAYTVLFAFVTVIAAWFATASSRLSYFGIQIAVGFYFIYSQEFRFQTSLAIARDRTLGVLLGLLMMWLAFDLLWSVPAAGEMKKAFVAAIRLLAQFVREPTSEDQRGTIQRTYALRDRINAQFNNVRSLADGVLFEFGPSRRQDLALRDHIRKWQPQLRTLFLMRIATLNYRLQLPLFELPRETQLWLQEYDARSAAILDELADRIEGSAPPQTAPLESSARIDQPPPGDGSFAALMRGIQNLMSSLTEEIRSATVTGRL